MSQTIERRECVSRVPERHRERMRPANTALEATGHSVRFLEGRVSVGYGPRLNLGVRPPSKATPTR